LSRPFRLNYVISFIFYLYLILYACVQRFDVTRNLKILTKFLASKRCLSLPPFVPRVGGASACCELAARPLSLIDRRHTEAASNSSLSLGQKLPLAMSYPSDAPACGDRPCLDPKFSLKFYYAKKKFFITSKCRHMHGVLNVDEIKN
jgi:hypothetical protein